MYFGIDIFYVKMKELQYDMLLTAEDEEALHYTPLIPDVSYCGDIVNVYGSHCSKGVGVLLIKWSCGTVQKCELLTNSEEFNTLVIRPFRACVVELQTVRYQGDEEKKVELEDYIQRVFVDKFHLSPNDLWKY